MEGIRTHDKFYLNENYKENPKEYFKLVKAELEKDFPHNNQMEILDIGCETGSFLHYLRREFPNSVLSGADVMQELLNQVNQPIDIGAKTYNCDISGNIECIHKQFDAVTLLGVMGIFDDYEPVINNMLSLTKDEGTIYIFSAFNPEKIDVLLRCRRSRDTGEWEKGWNIFSLDSIIDFCEKQNLSCEIIRFEMPFEIKKHEDDPLRSWTVRVGDHLAVVNGLQIVHHFYLLKIKRKL